MKKWILSAGLLGFTAVILGAFGAHALKEKLVAESSISIWQTAVFYQVSHSIAMLSVGLTMKSYPSIDRKWLPRACICWLLGILLFSGSLYWLALGGPKWLGPITPLGGILLLAGWIGVMIDGIKTPKTPSV